MRVDKAILVLAFARPHFHRFLLTLLRSVLEKVCVLISIVSCCISNFLKSVRRSFGRSDPSED